MRFAVLYAVAALCLVFSDSFIITQCSTASISKSLGSKRYSGVSVQMTAAKVKNSVLVEYEGRELISGNVNPRKKSRRDLLRETSVIPFSFLLNYSFPFGVQAKVSIDLGEVPQGLKIVVLGGTGFVGSRICSILSNAGLHVLSISRSGKRSSSGKITYIKGNPLTDDLTEYFKDAFSVVSCIGVIGTDDITLETGNGAVNIEAQKQAVSAGVDRFVYIGVANAVSDALENSPLTPYIRGKSAAEAAVVELFRENGTVVKPSFIYGGDSFNLNPPRVPDFYGAFLESVLNAKMMQSIARAFPGLLNVALTPPISVDDIANVCAAAALGRISGIFDGTGEIINVLKEYNSRTT